VTDTSEAAWAKAREDLESGHDELQQGMARLTDGQLVQTVLGQNYTVYVMLHGVIQHALYHAGQIALLKK
jgi:hypothetical protein